MDSRQLRDVGSAPTLGARLRRARRRRFVGRAGELELFRAAVEGPGAPWGVLFVHGPGGVGKTALLAAFAEAAAAVGTPVWRVDLRGVELSPGGFLAAVAGAMGVADGAAAVARLGSAGRRVLLIDTYESAAGLDGWVREGFLPGLGAESRVVVAGRDAPGRGWLDDAGWRDLLRVVALRNLSPGEARAFLRAAGVADDLHHRVLELTHGHPLALSLLVDVLDQRGDEGRVLGFDLGQAPDVLGVLLERFVAGVPSERHRRALEVCAHSRVTSQDLLRTALGGDDSEALFEWLRGLSFVESGADGLFPHDLAREALDADLRWRDRARYADVHHRVRRHVVARIRAGAGREQQRAVADLQFLHRGNAGIRGFYDWASLGEGYADGLRAGDAEAVVAMVERFETAESAALARFWLERQPRAFMVFRRPGRDVPFGFAVMLALHAASAEERAADPGAAAMWAYALAHGAPRPGEEVFAFRTYMDAEAYQAPSASFNVATILSVQHYVSCPRLAWDFIGGWADPDAIAPFMAHIDYARAPEADFEVGGRRYGVPVGSVVDARRGTLRLTTAADFKKGTVRRRLQSGRFRAAIFAIKQARSRKAAQSKRPPTIILLRTPPRKGRACAVRRPPKGAIRKVTATAKGIFRTVAGASTVTVTNATWTTQDRCDGTVTRVLRGRATVFDRNRGRTVRLRQGSSYRAKARLFGAKVKRRSPAP